MVVAEKSADSPPESVDKSGRRVRSMFSSIAGKYDLLNHLLSLNIDTLWRRFTTRMVPPEPGVPLLEPGLGTLTGVRRLPACGVRACWRPIAGRDGGRALGGHAYNSDGSGPAGQLPPPRHHQPRATAPQERPAGGRHVGRRHPRDRRLPRRR